jgi:pseudouridine-5'-phosphate glycosidase
MVLWYKHRMVKKIPGSFRISTEVLRCIQNGLPIVALESAVITHGLPKPENIYLAKALEDEVRRHAVMPATIAIIDGLVRIGLREMELKQLASLEKPARKISLRDFGIAIARGEMGGTTVAGTMTAASTAGIRVMATGGIGGVHRGSPFDVSADIFELSRTEMIVVCSGAKAILDLPATMEILETMGVPILGFQTDEVPAFYSPSSGLRVTLRIESASEVVEIARAQWNFGLHSAILVVVPPPVEAALQSEEIQAVIQQALDDAKNQEIIGAAVTPFLLSRVSLLSGGDSLRANLALLKNNACLAAQIATEWSRITRIIL